MLDTTEIIDWFLGISCRWLKWYENCANFDEDYKIYLWLLGFASRSPRPQRGILTTKLQPLLIIILTTDFYHLFIIKRIFYKNRLWLLGFEPGTPRPQRGILTTKQQPLLIIILTTDFYHLFIIKRIFYKNRLWLLGFEPRSPRPQRGILTTKLQPHFRDNFIIK
ncbi:hypothetical protein DEO72_LG2g1555 [Vigna unguiculata]|uniref:Uncharacterized protein n=1 Tax=Vigna unguiculata TaxID=3917 RepID=A0A4D6KWP7_VIGUN|nr:hypothetical protein DEO72_LG2g1555 [Vigna unguiculata]